MFPNPCRTTKAPRAQYQSWGGQVDCYWHMVGACREEGDFPRFEQWEEEGVCESQVDN